MKNSPRFTLLALGLLILAACAQGAQIPKTDQLVLAARQTVIDFKARKDFDAFPRLLKDAAGVAIFPTVFKAGFFVGAEGGNGLLVARDSGGRWGYPAFYTLGSGSFGLQFGGQQAEIVFIIRSRRAVEAIIAHQGKFGADVGATIGWLGAGLEGATTSNLGFDVIAFSGAKGLFGGMSLEGSAMIRRRDFNSQYYGADATPRAIVLENRHRNDQADGLRAALIVR